ncbi:MAG: Rieske 2Fe-2S domain-containing protein [Actinobacteria bacterium]|nr:Rieske 2Fe-2S domain-containing protein [Actinomycetota bacterium]
MTDLQTDEPRVLAKTDEVPDAYVRPFYLEDLKRRVAVVRVGGALHAFDDLCTCGGTPCSLASGLLDGTTLMCQCHGSRWDVVTGAVERGPATGPLRKYEATEADGKIRATVSAT